jgi:hypothetical protein
MKIRGEMTKTILKNKRLGILIILLVVVAATGAFLTLKNRPTAASSTTTSDTKVHAGPASDSSQKAEPQKQPQPQQVSTPDHPISSTLAKPIGPNNNTGTVSLSGGATTMESTCRSVAGVNCYIQATQNGRTIVVSDTKTIGSGTSDGVIFDWDAKQLSQGDWSITAVTTKDGQKATSDSQNLKVTP